MSRAHGRRGTGRTPDPQYGSFDKGIPGGIRHVDANAPAGQQEPAVAEPLDEFRGMMAHGVPPLDVGHYNREMAEHARHPYKPRYEDLPPAASPVPVYIVEGTAAPGVIRGAYPRSITCPASTSAEPARLCGRNPDRVEIRLLNEDTATDIRIAADLAALAAGTGALLPWPSNTYLAIPTQGELWAIGATGSGTPRLSIIEIFEQAAVTG